MQIAMFRGYDGRPEDATHQRTHISQIFVSRQILFPSNTSRVRISARPKISCVSAPNKPQNNHLDEFRGRNLSELDVVAMMVDGGFPGKGKLRDGGAGHRH
jgi:hypothetical protein